MGRGNRVGITASLDDQVSTRLDRIRDKFNTMGKGAAAASLAGNVGAMALAKGLSLTGRAVGAVIDYLGDAKDAYREDQLSIAQLNTSLAENVQGWHGTTRAIEQQLDAREKLGFTDEDLRVSLGRLVAATHDVDKALEIQSVAMDLARFKRISLSDATEALTKVEAGSFRILKSLGIVLKEGATQTEALAAVQKVAGRQAQAYAKSDLGQVEIATVRADEASEKFGKSLSRLEVAVLPAAADAVEGLANQIDLLQTGFDENVPAAQRLTVQYEALKTNGIIGMIPGLDELIDLMGEQVDVLVEDADAAEHHGDELIGVRNATIQATAPTEDLTGELKDLEGQARDTDRRISDLAETIVDELYGDTIRAGKAADLRGRIAEVTAELEKTGVGKRKAAELRGELAELRVELFNLHLEQASAKGPEAAIAFLQRERGQSGLARVAIKKLIDEYQKLADKQGALGPIIVPISATKLARLGALKEFGGPVAAGKPYIVGEAGPELFVPRTAGEIVSNDNLPTSGSGTTGGGGAPVIIQLQVDGRVLAEIVDEHLYYRRAAAPR